MMYEIVPTGDFAKELKSIAKKHRSILADMAELSSQIKENPKLGIHVGQNVYKIRLAISGSNKGKSGGARVITYFLVEDKTVYLAAIYLKGEYDTVDPNKVFIRLKDAGVI